MISVQGLDRVNIVVTENPFLLEEFHTPFDGAHFAILHRQTLDIAMECREIMGEPLGQVVASLRAIASFLGGLQRFNRFGETAFQESHGIFEYNLDVWIFVTFD